ncbi:MAG: PKD domain-containing protein, partial [Candidatus Bathyarchaeota archaeon]|nr:PKD domain-containing protein [Candidatus Bathyarchaeota archaeon]
MKAKLFMVLLVALSVVSSAYVSAPLPVLTVTTNNPTYHAGEALTINVTGGTPSQIVMLQIESSLGVKLWAVQAAFTVGGTYSYTLKTPAGYGAGTYTVRAKDQSIGNSGSTTFVVNVNQAPVANAGPDQSAHVGVTLTFNGSGSSDADGTIVSYFWAFGDGANATGVSVTHAYAAANVYTVTLTVTDNDGATGVDTATATVNLPPIANAAPTASISGPSEGKINEAASFNGVGTDTDGTIVSYAWTFGDGGSALGSSVSHTYTTAGTYAVTLTVTDNGGKTGTATVSLRIFNPPPSV